MKPIRDPRNTKTVGTGHKNTVARTLLAATLAASTPAFPAVLGGGAGGTTGPTDISDNPLSSSTSVQVKPNVMFLLDNSGSMAWAHMPDSVGSSTSSVGARNYQCNVIYYNPHITYVPPKNADGTDMPNSTFTNAKDDGYLSTSTTTDLSRTSSCTAGVTNCGFKAFNGNLNPADSSGGGSDTAQPAYYWIYTGSQTPVPSTGICNQVPSSQTTTTTITASPSPGTWNKIVVSATSGPSASDERQNFANWYTYYRRRVMMMKGTGSRAFNQLSSSYRVGFMLLNPYSGGNYATSGTKIDFVGASDFTTTQRNAWFSTLFATTTNQSTPLRFALSTAGRYYAGNKPLGITDDPMQYSCQQNFTLVVTDGYWNGGGGVKLDGTTAMDNEDGNGAITPRPLYDGSTATTTDKTTVANQFFDNSGCNSGKTRIKETDTVTTRVRTLDGAGNVTSDKTTTSSNTSNVTNCQSNPGPLQSPNPKTTTTSATATAGGSTGSLADVAAYYYNTDLRANGSLGAAVGSPAVQNDVGTNNNVPGTGTFPEGDTANWQHMTTFTMGLGLNGVLTYSSTYKTDTTGDFADIRNGAQNWPIPIADDPTALDDLWHAAVNGRGQFFSASDPDSVVQGLNTALQSINARTASAAAAATSNLQPVAGDNFAYIAKFETVSWTGELEAHQIDLTTGQVQPTIVWSAQSQLDAQTGDTCDDRVIYLFRKGANTTAANLVHFAWPSGTGGVGTFTCNGSRDVAGANTAVPDGLNAAEQAYFSSTAVSAGSSPWSQWTSMTTGANGTMDQRTPAVGMNLVNFLRGQRLYEGFIPNLPAFYRSRTHVLGDIVDAQPIFVRAPFASYGDTGYSAFATANASRTPMVYVAANDGMLHAFFAGSSLTDPQGGTEAWAFIPSGVLPTLYKLGDNAYGTHHSFYVDGTPTASDIFDTTAGVWKTILVGGLNEGTANSGTPTGGQEYYALDVTDPLHPKGLWEFKYSTTCYNPLDTTTWFSDCNLGLTYGDPIITKLTDGTWVVMVTSGYNNMNGASPNTNDGKGFLYILEAKSGKILYKIGTGVGSATTPSGLSKLNNWVDDTIHDNTTQRVYGVDLVGNVWRFDVDDNIAPAGREASLLATALDASGVPQPITTKPELAAVGSPPNPFVYVATGRYLGSSDIPANPSATQQTQSIYAIRDPMITGWSNLRTQLRDMVIADVGAGATETRTISCTNACTGTDGWFADLPDNGERVNVDQRLQLGTLVVASNIPANTACTVGGSSFLNFFDFATGGAVSTSVNGVVGVKLSDSLAVGLNVVRLPSGKTVVIATTSDAQQKTIDAPIGTPSPSGKRISWRELMQ